MPPPHSCDCQFHIFDDPAKYTLHQFSSRGAPDAKFEDIRKVHRTLGIERGVIVHSQRYDTDHRLLIDTLQGLSPEERKNIRATCVVKEHVKDSELELLNSLGVRGARLNIGMRWDDGVDPNSALKSMARVREIGWHARLHISGSDILEWGDRLLRVRDLTFCIDHMAHLQFALGIDQPAVKWICHELRTNPNWWMMLSNGYRDSAMEEGWDDAIPYARAYIESAPDRMIWGSDWPHTGWRGKRMFNEAEILELLYRYVDNDQVLLKKILVDNPARLHGFD
jgi:predicted TIM-barrel fold metal-dependent hydrolase